MKFNSDNPVCAMCPTLHERLVQRGMDSFLVDIDHRFGGQDIFALDDRLQADLVVMDPPFSWDVTAVRRALSAVSAPLVILVQPTSERALGICSEAQIIGEVEYCADVPDAVGQFEQVDPSKQESGQEEEECSSFVRSRLEQRLPRNIGIDSMVWVEGEDEAGRFRIHGHATPVV